MNREELKNDDDNTFDWQKLESKSIVYYEYHDGEELHYVALNYNDGEPRYVVDYNGNDSDYYTYQEDARWTFDLLKNKILKLENNNG
tara:strand:- start:47 stop:307 length:261 start_codon:yes stop_codon:yes gene_type:complete